MTERLIVIGNGMVGLRLLDELCRLAPERYEVTVIGAEPVPAYNRVLLSALLAGDVRGADLEYHPAAWYVGRGLRLKLGVPVTAVSARARQVITADGETLPFDRLVLATGSEALRPPIDGMDLEAVLTFRDLGDVARMEALLPSCGRTVVIGGGLLGLEAAYGLAKRGLSVTVIHLMDRLMERQLDAPAARLLQRSLAARDIAVRLNARTTRVLGRARAEGVRLEGGETLPADLVVAAVGIRPLTALAEAAGIACDRGVLVDDHLETSQPGIYAIGECARHAGICYGLVAPAYEQAAVLARRLAGQAAVYHGSLVATSLKVSGVDVFSAGDFLGEAASDEVVLSDPGAGVYRKLVLREGRLTGAVLCGDTADSQFYLDLMRSAQPVGQIKTDLVFGRALVEAA